VHPFISLGRLQLPVFGLFAAAGLMAAMMLGLRTARMAGIDRDAFWDTGMLAVFSAFLLSRALLVVENMRLFFAYPLLLLHLPSLTDGGLLLAALVTALYMRRRRLPLLCALDAAAPCAALLAAVLAFGRFADGTREGMPMAWRWAVTSAFGRVHPVELYSAIAWLAACAVLLWVLRRAKRAGETAAWGLLLGGLLLFVLDFFHLPAVFYGNAWLDRVQWRALMLIGGGCLMLVSLTDVREEDVRENGLAIGPEGAGDAL
jgi:phosphatidylglycerol:prolipoprotein diacylglycerol transferase